MNQKEINELRRRFRPEKSTISRVYGCYVNSSKEIVSDLDESLGMMPQEESEKYLSLLKKGLSGSLGKNLIDIVFSTQQVADSEGHRLLTTLRDSQLMSLFWILLAPAVGKWFARASKLSRRLPARWSYSTRIRPLSRSMTARCSAAPP